ncbi:MAG: CheF family chemotaxis protein [Halodesulfurarchaeum sp.]
MTDPVVADFVTDVVPDTAEWTEPVRGRVVMSTDQVVIATAEDRRTIRIAEIFDVAYGSAPSDLSRFFEDTVSIAYEDGFGRHVALIEGADETVSRFTDLLFKAIINGTEVLVKHPARVGGRVTDESVQTMTVFLRKPQVVFSGADRFHIEVSTVSNFEKLDREVRGRTRSVLSVRHALDMQEVTSEISLDSGRKMNVLGRYLRIEYSTLRDQLASIELRDVELEALLGMYSGGDDAKLAGMLGIEPNRVTMILNGLLEKDLLAESDSGMTLTPLGKMAVNTRIESINT